MKMFTNFKVFAILMSILSAALAKCASSESESSYKLDAKCSAYVFSIVKPMLENFAKVRNETEIKNKKISELEQIVKTNAAKCETSEMQNSKNPAEIIQTQLNLAFCEKNVSDKDVELNRLKNKLAEYNQKIEHLSTSCIDFENYSGTLLLKAEGLEPFLVSCDSKLAGSGWTVIQRRIDGKVDFYRPWEDYKHGFGNVKEEFWLGLEKLHRMTNAHRYELYIQLVDQRNETRYASYDNFRIANEQEKYMLVSVGNYSGNAGDSMKGHVYNHFSTYDSDKSIGSHSSCASRLQGAWWYWNCAFSNLNGKRFDCNVEDSHELEFTGCIYWQHWHGRSYSLKYVQMMIRPYASD